MKIIIELTQRDAEIIASWIDDIVEMGISKEAAPAFRRLEKKLLKPLPSSREVFSNSPKNAYKND